MITSKKEYSTLCQSIRKHLVEAGGNIKLASVREALALSLKYKSASALLVDLPVSLDMDTCDNLNNLLKHNHRIDADLSTSTLPHPKNIPLNVYEIQLAWLDAKQRYLTQGSSSKAIKINAMLQLLAGDDLLSIDPPVGMRPDGKGGWLCDEHNEMSEMMSGFSTYSREEDELYSTDIIQEALNGVTPALLDYWTEHSQWLISSAASKILQTTVVDKDGEPVQLSEHINTLFNEFISEFGESRSNAYNRYESMQNANMHSQDSLVSFLDESLIQGAIGHCIFNEMGNYDYEAILWGVLDKMKPRGELNPSRSTRDNHSHFSEYLYSDEFKEGIRILGANWLAKHQDWTKPLQALAIKDFKVPRPLENPYFRVKDGEFDKKFNNGGSLTTYIAPYGRGEEEFGYHDDIEDDFEVKTFSDFLEIDEDELRKELKRDVENGELEESVMEDVFNEIVDEAKYGAEEEYSTYKFELPFVKPFRLEQFTIERQTENGDTVFVADGKYFSDLDETNDIGFYYNTLDAMSRELSNVSSFFRDNSFEFEGVYSDVLYITELVLSKGATPKSIAQEIRDGLVLSGREPDECIIIVADEALTHAYFIGAPYSGCEPLSDIYWGFVHDLIDELGAHFDHAQYINS